VPAGTATIRIQNAGATEHNFVVQGIGKSPMLAAGDSTTIKLEDLEPGTLHLLLRGLGPSGGRHGGDPDGQG
jgi:hypothetical protein